MPATTAPAVDSTAVPDTSSAPAVDTPPQTTTVHKTVVKRSATAVAAKPAPVVTRSSSQSIATHVVKAAPAAPSAAATAAVRPAPAVDMSAKPAPTPVAAKRPTTNNDTALELGGGALALLALGGAAYAISRRRRHAYDDAWADDQLEPVPAEPAAVAPTHTRDEVAEPEPAMVAPPISAFAWGNRGQEQQASSDRKPAETWVERARRGPTPDNPSLSLRKRLKRAAFFDKREREAAAGRAAPVEADAGLPEAALDEQILEAA